MVEYHLRKYPKLQLVAVDYGGVGYKPNRGALACGFPTDRWTLERVRQLIQKEFKVSYHPNYLNRLLRSLGFSPQRPLPPIPCQICGETEHRTLYCPKAKELGFQLGCFFKIATSTEKCTAFCTQCTDRWRTAAY